MTEPKKNKARKEAGSDVAAGGQAKATFENVRHKHHSASSSAGTEKGILASKSIGTKAQLAKVLALLRTGLKTTIELRAHCKCARYHFEAEAPAKGDA